MKRRFQLFETKEYDRFNWIEGNREINDRNVTNIEKSILEHGLQVPIVVNENYEIIDGQHRFVALRRNNMVVPYVVSSVATEDSIPKLQESRKWTALDHCKSNAQKGDLSCIQALELADAWFRDSQKKMSKQRTIELLMDGKSSSGLLTRLKNGTFTIDTECAYSVYGAVLVMDGMDMGTSPYGQKITRSLKVLYHEFGELDIDAIIHMTETNYIKAYSNESDQVEYMKDKYTASLKALKKNKST